MTLTAPRAGSSLLVLLAIAACSTDSNGVVATNPPPTTITVNPCSVSGTLSLAVATGSRVDCTNGGSTLTLAGNGASYIIIPQFATDLGSDTFVSYSLATGTPSATAASADRFSASKLGFDAMLGARSPNGSPLPSRRNLHAERAMAKVLRARWNSKGASQVLRSRVQATGRRSLVAAAVVPAPGSLRSFHVINSSAGTTYSTVTAKLSYVGNSLLVYIDTVGAANGFTAAQLQPYAALMDQTMYPIDTGAFGGPSDIDGNGHVIMLMSPVINAITPAASCALNGYTGGFFDPSDFDGPADLTSNQGEIFYSVAPDPNGEFSCAHTAASLGTDIPDSFLYFFQHLINFSQHVVVNGGAPMTSWMDEGMSIAAEELGSLYYEQRCPPPACRTNGSQLFPDSSQGFVSGFFYDSYEYALIPDTSAVTLGDQSDANFSWRGGAWLLMRYLADQYGTSIFKRFETGPSDAVTNIQLATGQTFQALFSNFGIALYADSLPGLPRGTAPLVNRFTTRNMPAMWARLYATSGPASDIPTARPIQLFPINNDTSSSILVPGGMSYWRLDTPSTAATVTIRFSGPGGTHFASNLKPQLAVFRLPAGQ